MIHLNSQPPEKPDHAADGTVEVHSVFLTIQGEGPFAGRPAVFCRLTGCNLQCMGCDTEYTATRTRMTPLQVLEAVQKVAGRTNLVVVTGGEPFRQNIAAMTRELLYCGYEVQIETNGTLYLENFPYSSPKVTIVCSPKAGSVHPELKRYVKDLKYVVEAGQIAPDGLPTTTMATPGRVARPWESFNGTVWLQPLDEGDPTVNKDNMRAAVEACLTLGYRMSVQTHKLLGVE